MVHSYLSNLALLQGNGSVGATGSFLDILGILEVGAWVLPVLGLILLPIALVVTFILYRLLSRVLERKIQEQGSSVDLFNGLKFFLRIFVTILVVVWILWFLNIQSEYALVVSGVIASAVAFASMKAINNFVAGIWTVLTRPFVVGDYVAIGAIEGIVFEISLNYTQIRHSDGNITLIPNLTVMKSDITNYTISIDDLRRRVSRIEQSIAKSDQALKKNQVTTNLKGTSAVIANLEEELAETRAVLETIEGVANSMGKHGESTVKRSRYAQAGKVVRYSLSLGLTKHPKRNREILNEVCRKWEPEFEIRPTWRMSEIGARFFYDVIVLTPDPEDIYLFHDDFMMDVYRRLHGSSE